MEKTDVCAHAQDAAAGPWVEAKEYLPKYPGKRGQKYLVISTDGSLNLRSWSELTILDRTAKDASFKPVFWAEVKI